MNDSQKPRLQRFLHAWGPPITVIGAVMLLAGAMSKVESRSPEYRLVVLSVNGDTTLSMIGTDCYATTERTRILTNRFYTEVNVGSGQAFCLPTGREVER